MQPKLAIMNWVLSDSPSHNVGHAKQHSIIEQKWYIWDQVQASLKGTSNLHEELAQVPMTPTPSTLLSFSRPALMASWGVPCGKLTEATNQCFSLASMFLSFSLSFPLSLNAIKKNALRQGLKYIHFYRWFACPTDTTWEWTGVSTTAPFWNIPEQWWEICQAGRTFSFISDDFSCCLKLEMIRAISLYQLIGYVWVDKELEETQLEN